MSKCESCRAEGAIETVPSATDGHAFALCSRCSQSLRQQELSPEQWLNVASIHTGQVFELHEDFYGMHGERWDDDSADVWRIRDFRGNLQRLFDVVVAWSGDLELGKGRELIEELRQFNPSEVKAELESRLMAAKYTNVCIALMKAARCGIVSNSDASQVARRLASSVGADNLSAWVKLSMNRLPWPIIREKFFEVVRSVPPESRRFRLVALDHLARTVDPTRRKGVVAEFLRLLPPREVSRSLAMYVDLVNAPDRPGLVSELLADKVLSDQVAESQHPAGLSRNEAQYWDWGQVAAACGSDWSVQFFGRERGCWRIVCSAVEIALGRHAHKVYPGVQDALRSEVGLEERWSRVEAELKSGGLWVEP